MSLSLRRTFFSRPSNRYPFLETHCTSLVIMPTRVSSGESTALNLGALAHGIFVFMHHSPYVYFTILELSNDILSMSLLSELSLQ
jgi:hypothetical protein